MADRQQTTAPRAVSAYPTEEESSEFAIEASDDNGEFTLAVTPDILTKVLESALPDDFLLEDIQLDMPAENRLSLTANVSKQRLQAYLQEKQLDTLAAKTALYFLPESSPIAAEFSLESTGRAVVSCFPPVAVTIGDWKVPAAMLSPVFLEEIGQAVNEGMLTGEWFSNEFLPRMASGYWIQNNKKADQKLACFFMVND